MSNKNNNQYCVNDEIRNYREVRLLYSQKNGEGFNKVVSLYEAKKIANDMQLDLIEINNRTDPPILRLDEYSKFLYEQKKLEKKKKQPKNQLKEIQLSVNISDHDILTKVNHAKRFLSSNQKVKLVLTLKGREQANKEANKKSLYQFLLYIEDYGVPESLPKDEGNKCIVILKPKK